MHFHWHCFFSHRKIIFNFLILKLFERHGFQVLLIILGFQGASYPSSISIEIFFCLHCKIKTKEKLRILKKRISLILKILWEFVCFYLFVFIKRQNGWTDWAQIVFRTSRDPREGLWVIEFSKITFSKTLKIHDIFFIKSANFFYNAVQRENVHNWNRRYR